MMIDALFSVGNVLYLTAYSVRDILWLRILTVVGTLCLMPLYIFREEPLYAPITWSTLFVLINLYQIAILMLERRPVFLNEKELQLYRTIFQTLKPREFANLLAIADWKKTPAGDELLEQGKPVDQLMLITDGKGSVKLDGRPVADVATGQFVGEMAFLTDEDASASVSAVISTEVLSWPVKKLRELLQDKPQLHVKIQNILGTDLAAKLRKDGAAPGHPSALFTSMQRQVT